MPHPLGYGSKQCYAFNFRRFQLENRGPPLVAAGVELPFWHPLGDHWLTAANLTVRR
jgi:hypothetical protein